MANVDNSGNNSHLSDDINDLINGVVSGSGSGGGGGGNSIGSGSIGSSITSGIRRVVTVKHQAYGVTQLKQKLDAWKVILLPVNSLLEWERRYDPIIIIILDTLLFGLLWYYNPSILTTISIIGLLLLILETAVPLITGYVFKTTEWDSVSESKYTRICERISNLHQHILNFRTKLENTRKEKQPLYFLLVFFFLVFCAYVGQSVDNFLLTYLAVLVITLTPGARRRNFLQTLLNNFKNAIGISSKPANENWKSYDPKRK